MEKYRIKTAQRSGEDYKTMIILDDTWDEIAEYRLDPGTEKSQIARTRRAINRHLDDGGTLANYNW